ncbi:MAG: M43 family zinc metalloprotease [Bacteroidota bacterium]
MKTLRFKNLLAFLFCTLLFSSNLFSQEKCATQKIHEHKFANDISYRNAFLNAQQVNEQNIKPPMSKSGGTVYKIPVVVHVIHLGEAVGTGTNISDDQVLSCINSMNDAYRKKAGSTGFGNGVDTEIEFCLAQKDPSGNPSTGINRVSGTGVSAYSTSGLTTEGGSPNEVAVKALSKWDNTKYYNLWVVSEIDGNNGGAGTQGFAYFPGAGSTIDGAVMLYNAFGYDPDGSKGYNLKSYTNRNRTLIHEIGHGLNLYHTFQGDDSNSDGTADQCPTNATCSTQGDRVCDTPPHQRSTSNCATGTNSCDGNSSRELFIHNYMDYSSDVCQNEFTAGQASRMSAVIMTGGTRQSLSTAANLDNCGCNIPIPRFYATTTTPCLGMPVQFIDESINFPTSWTWSFSGGSPTSSTSQNPSVTYATTGTFNVSLTAISSTGVSSTTTKTAYINPIGSKSIPYLENFEGTFPPSGWTNVSADAATAWGTEGSKMFEKRSATGNTGSTVGSAGMNCYNYNSGGTNLDALISPPISLSGLSIASLTYKTAYRYFGSAANADTLKIYVSTDCGNTFTKIQQLGGTQLSSITNGASGFTPSATGDWILRSFNLDSYVGQNLIVKFEVKNQYGQNLYIDDVAVNGSGSANTITTSAISGSPFCAGATGISVPYTITGTFTAGNIFTAQLSDASGSFASPTVLGTLSSTAAGTINTTVGLPAVAGTAYRIRVVSSTPSITGTDNGTNLTINTLSTAPTGITGTTTICSGSTTTLTLSGGSAGTGATAQWFSGSCGGTAAGTGNSISVSPTSTTTYYLRYSGTCNTTACASVVVTVNTLSTAPSGITGTTTICNGGSTTLTRSGGTAGTGATATWYSSSCGGTLVGTGNSVLVSPTVTTTYYVRYEGTCNTTTCASVVVTVNTLSTAPSGITGTTTICAGGTTTLTITGGSAGTGATAFWYTASCGGGTLVGTGNSVVVSPASTTSYFVRYEGTCNNTTCASTSVTVNTLSTAPTGVTGTTTICTGGTTTLTLSGGSAGTGAVARWYSASCGGTLVGTGNSVVVSPASTTSYFVRYEGTCNNTACASTSVTVNTLSTAPTGVTGTTTICTGGTTTLTLTGGSAGTGAVANWYSGSCGGALVGTGNSVVVSPSSNTNYFVRYEGTCNNTTCASTSVTVNTTVSPIVTINASSTTICSGVTATYTAIPTEGGSSPGYQWKINGNDEGSNSSTFVSTFTNNDLVSCVMTSNSACASPLTATSNVVTMTVNSSTITINQQPSNTSACFNSSAAFAVNASGVDSYKWQVSNGGAFVDVNNGGLYSGTTTATLTINNLSGLNNYQYKCILTDNCGLFETNAATLVVDPGTTFYQDADNDGFGNPSVSIITCTAPLSYVVNNTDCDDSNNLIGDGPCGPVGPTTQLSTSCGATNLLKNNLIYATAIPGAGKYKFTFSNGQSYTTGNYNPIMYLYQVSALQFGSTYGVTVQAYINGVLTNPGAVCSVTLAAFPTTQLSTVSAGATNLTPASYIYCNGITGATYYKFTCSNGRSYTTTNNSPSMLLSNLGVTYGTSYTVAVQAYSAGVWNTVGTSLPIFMADFPTTQLSGTSCNMTVTKTSIIYANSVAGGYRYKFNVTDNGSYTRSFITGNTLPQTSLSNFPGLLDGQSYVVTVQAYVGGVWGVPGAPCSIFVGGLLRSANNEEVAVVENNNEMISQEAVQVISEEIVTEEVKTAPAVEENSTINVAAKAEFTAYPNPVSKSSVLNISFNTEEIGKVILMDVTSRIITEQNFNTNLNSIVEIDLADKKLDNGIYNLSIIGNKSTSQKTIVVVE